MRHFVRNIAVLLVVTAGTGCATLARQAFAPPRVTVNDVRLAGIGFDGGRLDVHVSLFNPNGFRIDATSVEYRVLVDTVELANGSIDQHVTIHKRDSTSLRFPVLFSLREVASATTMLTARGSLPFQLIGRIRIATPFGSVTRPFDERGTYDGLNISIMPRR